MGKIRDTKKLHDASMLVKIATIVAFIGVAGIVAATTFRASSEIESMVIANGSGVPKAWSTEQSVDAVANSSLSAEVVGQKYIRFLAEVTNANASKGLYVTHVASYLSSNDGSMADGFVSLSDKSLEYSYSPEDENSWQKANLTEPTKSKNAFKLSNEVHLGAAGTNTDKVYFRYYVEPNNADVETVNNKISYLLRSDSGEMGYATSAAVVAYKEASRPTAIAKADEADSSETGNAYVAPLGKSSFVPETETVSQTVASVGMNSDAFLTVGVVMLVVGVAIFAICLAIYLPLKKY